jgi:KDO2-lipid IV(A) lauroyltransferase
MNLKDLKWYAAYITLMTVMIPFTIIPLRLSVWTGGQLGKVLYFILPKWRRIGLETISLLLPQLEKYPEWRERACSPDDVIRQVFVNMGIFIAELSRLYFGKDKELLESVEFKGLEHFERAREKGGGIIGITAHCGNWELMPLAIGAMVTPIAIIARTMKKDYFNRALEKIRLRHGNRIIYRDSGVKVMFSFLKSNGIMGMLPDQVVKAPHGILADFFGRPAWTTVMPVKLALKTGSPLIPFFIHREGGKNIITIYPEIELMTTGSDNERILDGTVKMNRAIEHHIIRYPDQWNWLYRRWKGTESHSGVKSVNNGALP